MYTFSNEQEFRRILVMFLDGALSPEDERDFMAEMRNSPDYMAQFQKEQSFREFLRQKVQRRDVSPALIESIKSKIAGSYTNQEV